MPVPPLACRLGMSFPTKQLPARQRRSRRSGRTQLESHHRIGLRILSALKGLQVFGDKSSQAEAASCLLCGRIDHQEKPPAAAVLLYRCRPRASPMAALMRRPEPGRTAEGFLLIQTLVRARIESCNGRGAVRYR